MQHDGQMPKDAGVCARRPHQKKNDNTLPERSWHLTSLVASFAARLPPPAWPELLGSRGSDASGAACPSE